MSAPGLGPVQKAILGILAEGPATTADLEKRLPDYSAAAISNSLRKLADSRPGLARVAQERDLKVRGSRQVWAITEAGRAVAEEAS